MAKIVTNHDLPNITNPSHRYQAYCCLDTCITLGVWRNLYPMLDDASRLVYGFERGMQNVAMTLMCRGIRINEQAAWKAVREVEEGEVRVRRVLDRLAEVWWGKGLNPHSSPQKKAFLYELLGLPVQRDKYGKVSTGREALENLAKKAPWAWVILRCLMRATDLHKQLSFLQARRSEDGKIRASFNVGATETGRWSSSKNPFGEGLNYQNVFKKLRYIFVPLPGRKMGNADLEQAESRTVAYLANDEDYIAAHETADTHTTVAKMIWRDIEWPEGPCPDCNGEDPKCKPCGGSGLADVRLAREKNFYRHFSRRDLSKRMQHLLNYLGTEYILSIVLRIERKFAKENMDMYFRSYPGIKDWHRSQIGELRRTGILTTPLGRRRQFYNRVWDAGTHREAIAHVPQSVIGDVLNVGLYRVWRYMDGRELCLLHQGHDSILFEYSERLSPEIEWLLLERVRKLLTVEFDIAGKTVSIPVDVKTGTNWLEACGD